MVVKLNGEKIRKLKGIKHFMQYDVIEFYRLFLCENRKEKLASILWFTIIIIISSTNMETKNLKQILVKAFCVCKNVSGNIYKIISRLSLASTDHSAHIFLTYLNLSYIFGFDEIYVCRRNIWTYNYAEVKRVSGGALFFYFLSFCRIWQK